VRGQGEEYGGIREDCFFAYDMKCLDLNREAILLAICSKF